ncbi:MAG: DUF4124 domain-containing protein [Zoogloeaceae bacterium]|nr:DUF4124 domain-containing protein [Zoogloeaceae bacterium]
MCIHPFHPSRLAGFALGALLFLVSVTARGEEVYRCVENGRTTISVAPCSANAKSERIIRGAEVYRCIENGKTTISDMPCSANAKSERIIVDATSAETARESKERLARMKEEADRMEHTRLEREAAYETHRAARVAARPAARPEDRGALALAPYDWERVYYAPTPVDRPSGSFTRRRTDAGGNAQDVNKNKFEGSFARQTDAGGNTPIRRAYYPVSGPSSQTDAGESNQAGESDRVPTRFSSTSTDPGTELTKRFHHRVISISGFRDAVRATEESPAKFSKR